MGKCTRALSGIENRRGVDTGIIYYPDEGGFFEFRRIGDLGLVGIIVCNGGEMCGRIFAECAITMRVEASRCSLRINTSPEPPPPPAVVSGTRDTNHNTSPANSFISKSCERVSLFRK